ncbi:MAG: hypothetical protein ABEI07_02785 [Candidatus Nanohaloarchaea archaeon]
MTADDRFKFHAGENTGALRAIEKYVIPLYRDILYGNAGSPGGGGPGISGVPEDTAGTDGEDPGYDGKYGVSVDVEAGVPEDAAAKKYSDLSGILGILDSSAHASYDVSVKAENAGDVEKALQESEKLRVALGDENAGFYGDIVENLDISDVESVRDLLEHDVYGDHVDVRYEDETTTRRTPWQEVEDVETNYVVQFSDVEELLDPDEFQIWDAGEYTFSAALIDDPNADSPADQIYDAAYGRDDFEVGGEPWDWSGLKEDFTDTYSRLERSVWGSPPVEEEEPEGLGNRAKKSRKEVLRDVGTHIAVDAARERINPIDHIMKRLEGKKSEA